MVWELLNKVVCFSPSTVPDGALGHDVPFGVVLLPFGLASNHFNLILTSHVVFAISCRYGTLDMGQGHGTDTGQGHRT